MCGIHFILDKQSRLDSGPIEAMVSSTRYRGPDDQEFKVYKISDSQYFLGANKLSITDQSSNSKQPFSKGSSPHTLIYNGEIYNYQSLKNQLLNEGISFVSASDTEVLYHLLISKGPAVVPDLNGMFAFILINSRNGEILIARDRWGMKPLYVFEDSRFLIISSELRGILSSGLVRKELNEQAVDYYLKYRYVRSPHTFFRGIKEYSPNAYSLHNSDGKIKDGVISVDPVINDNIESDRIEAEVLKETDHLLSEAILVHQHSLGNTGLFLSGGVDSTLILAKMHELGIRQVPTFSLVSSQDHRRYGTEDYKFSRLAAKKYQAQHHELTTSINLADTLDEYISMVDQPIGDSGGFMTWLLSQGAGKSLKVVLSGAGADEMFAGYNRHRAFNFYLENKTLLLSMRSLGINISSLIRIFNLKRGHMYYHFFRSLEKNPRMTWENFITMHEFEGASLPELQDPGLFGFDDSLKDDRDNYLINDVLAVNDRNSMLTSLEMRMPYLDKSLTAFIQSLPGKFLIRKGPKSILKELLSKRGGKIFCQRKKEGFGLPFGSWIDKDEKGMWDFLKEKNHIVFKFVPSIRISQMLEGQRSGKSDHTLALWSVLVLSKWLEANFAK